MLTKKIMRGLRDIKTISGRVDDRATPFKAYMKLSVLEMEKYRRGKEKQSALERVRTIDQRFREIEAEKQEIINSLAAQGLPGNTPAMKHGPAAAPRASTGPLKVRY